MTWPNPDLAAELDQLGPPDARWAAGIRELRDALVDDETPWVVKARTVVTAYELLYAHDLDTPADHPRAYGRAREARRRS